MRVMDTNSTIIWIICDFIKTYSIHHEAIQELRNKRWCGRWFVKTQKHLNIIIRLANP